MDWPGATVHIRLFGENFKKISEFHRRACLKPTESSSLVKVSP